MKMRRLGNNRNTFYELYNIVRKIFNIWKCVDLETKSFDKWKNNLKYYKDLTIFEMYKRHLTDEEVKVIEKYEGENN